MSDSLNAVLQDNYTLKAQLQNMSDTLMKQTCRVMSLVAENKQLQKTLEPLRKEVADLTQGHHRMGGETYAYLCRTLAAEKRAETAERKVIELSALLEHMPELRRALDVAQAENEQLRALNEKALPLSEKEYIGALKGVPLFTHRGSQLAALATLGEIQHERADLERRLTEAKRALDEALNTIKRHEAELDSVLSKPKSDLALVRKENFFLDNQVTVLKKDLRTTTQREQNLSEKLTQAVKDKDVAIEQAMAWKRKYLTLKSLNSGANIGHAECRLPVEEMSKLAEECRGWYPPITGETTGRISCAQPNMSNPPQTKEVRCLDRNIQSLYAGAVVMADGGWCHTVKDVWAIGPQVYALTEATYGKGNTVWQQEGADLVPVKEPVPLPADYKPAAGKTTWALGDLVQLPGPLYGTVSCIDYRYEGRTVTAVRIMVLYKDKKRNYWFIRRRLGGPLDFNTGRYSETMV